MKFFKGIKRLIFLIHWRIDKIWYKLDAIVNVKKVGYGISFSLEKKLADTGDIEVELQVQFSWSEVSRDVVFLGNPTTECIESIPKSVKNVKI